MNNHYIPLYPWGYYPAHHSGPQAEGNLQQGLDSYGQDIVMSTLGVPSYVPGVALPVAATSSGVESSYETLA